MDYENIKKELGLKIKSYRISKGLTQEQFCAIIELEQPNLSNIENGKTFPDIATLCAIIEKGSIEPNYLFSGLIKNKQNFTSIDIEIASILTELPISTKQKIKELLETIKIS